MALHPGVQSDDEEKVMEKSNRRERSAINKVASQLVLGEKHPSRVENMRYERHSSLAAG